MASPGRIDSLLAAEIDRLATALAKDPRSKSFMPLAESYMKADMWQEAAGVLEDGLRVYPGFVTAMAALGRAYEQLGQPAKAKAILEEVVAQSPDNLRAHRILARIFSSEGQVDPALKSCAAILAVNPYDEEALTIRQAVGGGRSADDESMARAKREKNRLEQHNDQRKNGNGPQQAMIIPEPIVSTVPEQTDAEPVSAPSMTPCSAAVAQLEVWLKTIRSRRMPAPQ
ncbi:MAG TPA: tetratricopeptide repeat protein [Nitrospiraceae bacterium]|nr:tetratricopeptide repeat protein [Nitrospiraceae bacterium]